LRRSLSLGEVCPQGSDATRMHLHEFCPVHSSQLSCDISSGRREHFLDFRQHLGNKRKGADFAPLKGTC
jgi:hypothetical protein